MASSSGKLAFAIIKAGFIAGTLDICIAFLQYYLKTGKEPANVLRFIAGGVFGNQAFSGGAAMAGAGLVFHYMIAFSWTIIFFLLYPRIALMRKNIMITAFAFGVLVWCFMNLLVLPLSALPSLHADLKQSITALLILVVAIGFPLSFFAKKYYRI